MLTSHWLALPAILQMLCTTVDECVFHRKRGLPRWERVGHVLDTLTVSACFVWVVFMPPSARNVLVFAGLAIFSSLFVTKDEVVHYRHCGAGEQWLHACLFTLHPVVLASAGLLWPAAHGLSGDLAGWVRFHGFERAFLSFSCAATLLWAAYQFVYWNLIWPRTGAR